MNRSERRALALVVAVATVALAYRALLAERETVDDVFIYLRYARNLAERGEIAFSPGDRVEGASSVLWTLLLGAAWKLGATGAHAAKALSFVCGVSLPATCALAVRRAAPERPIVAAIPAVAIALDCDVALWSASGMDTAAWALACTACVAVAASGKTRAAALAIGMLPWVRPEGPLLTALGAIALALPLARTNRREIVSLLTIAAIPTILLTITRAAYFHDVVPNTFYAKMRAVDGRDFTGWGYALSELARRPLLLLLPLALLARSRAHAPAMALACALFLFILVAGGDWMPNRRLLVPVLPLAATAAAIGAARLSARAHALLAGALLVESALSTTRSLDQRWRWDEYLDRRLASAKITWRPFVDPYPLDWMPTHLLHVIAPYARPGETVAHVDVGELPYAAHDVAILDGFGLVDREAARATYFAHDPTRVAAAREAFFAKDPVVAIVVLDRTTLRAISPSQDAALSDPRFSQRYREVDRVPSWGQNPCVTFVRNDREASSADEAAARVRGWLDRVPDVRPAF